MSNQEYNKQKIIKYLLGSLPDAEAEQFDELSFTDDNFADALKSTENDLIDSYVQGELIGETLETFKTNYLASPLRREKVKFAESFQGYAKKELAKTAEQRPVVEEAKAEKDAGFLSSISAFFASMKALQWGFAAVILMVIALGGFWLSKRATQNGDDTIAKQNTPAPINQPSPKPSNEVPSVIPTPETRSVNKEPELAQQKNATEPSNKPQVIKTPEVHKPETSPSISRAIIASLILPPPMRGSGESGGGRNQFPTVSIPAQPGDVAMHLELEADEFPNYQVSLTDQNGKQLWNSGAKLKATSSGAKKMLNIRFPAKLLKSQIFSLVVSGIQSKGGEPEIISNYPFRAVVE